jgi:hypothetical protein
MYMINKHMIVDVFGVCAKRYVQGLKGQVSKIIKLQALQNCKIAPTNSARD